MRKYVLALSGLLLFVGTHASADTGAFAGVSVGSSVVKETSEGVTFKGSDFAWAAWGGYMFSDNFGIEAGWADWGKADDTIQGIKAEIDASGYQVVLLGVLPINDNIDLLGKAGVAVWDSEYFIESVSIGKDDGNDLALGIGARWNMDNGIGIRAELEWYDIPDTDRAWLIMAGLQWNFK
jgi:OOP family OmpA-OmpF porin